MCGITAVVTTSDKVDTAAVLLEGLTILQNRGYDSAGIATINGAKKLAIQKYASVGSTSDSLQLLVDAVGEKKLHTGATVGIGHTRWATHGGKTDENAHPHPDWCDRIAVVHNGTIENFAPLKDKLMANDVTFRSTTDTEVISNLIAWEYDRTLKAAPADTPVTSSLHLAIQAALTQLKGTFALAILCVDAPEQLVVARNGMPIVIGLGDDASFVASEHCAFANFTSKFMGVEDHELLCVATTGITDVVTGKAIDVAARTKTAAHEEIALTPGEYEHWTLKEINDQPRAIQASMGDGTRLQGSQVALRGLDPHVHKLLNIHHLLITGCGTSFFSARFGAILMRHLRAFDTVQVVDAAEMTFEQLPRLNAGLLAVSQSGETKDVHRAVVLAMERAIPTFSVINGVGSLIARTTKCGVYANAGREQAVASTKAFVCQCICFSLIAIWFSQHRKRHDKTDDYMSPRHLGRQTSLDGLDVDPDREPVPHLSAVQLAKRTDAPEILTPTLETRDNKAAKEAKEKLLGTSPALTPLSPSHDAAEATSPANVRSLASDSLELGGSPTKQAMDTAPPLASCSTTTSEQFYAIRHEEAVSSLRRLSALSSQVIANDEPITKIADKIKDQEHMFVLGKGFAEPIACEAALKIKEITYIHAEGYSGGALKHGPFALIEKGTPIILIILQDRHSSFMQTAAHEVKARGAHTIVITDMVDLDLELADDVVHIPNCGIMSSVLAVIVLQLLAYKLAIARGIDPDKPRNLAKAVTVD